MKIPFYISLVVILTSFSPKNNYNYSTHQDFQIIKDYGNIKTRITTGFHYEEIKKIEFIGYYAQILAEKLNYKKKYFLILITFMLKIVNLIILYPKEKRPFHI